MVRLTRRVYAHISDFPYLLQAFTQGERWKVVPDHLDRLVAADQIDDAQRARFWPSVDRRFHPRQEPGSTAYPAPVVYSLV